MKTKETNEIEELLNRTSTAFQRFYQASKNVRFRKDIKNPPESWKKVYFKSYFRFKQIKLPKSKLPKITLSETLLKRTSTREFSKEKVTLKTISSLLYYSAGIKNLNENSYPLRFYPSGGGRYPLEIYLLPFNTELPNGIYHYYPKANSLEYILSFKKMNFRKYFDQEWIKNSAFVIIVTGVFIRTTIKYGERGYRHVLIDTGHLGQNFYLNSAPLNLGCCEVAGFKEDTLNKLIDIDGIQESVISTFAFGNKIK